MTSAADTPEHEMIRGSILGTRVLRTEDPGLLTGANRYVADLPLDRPLHAVFVRSELAHGTIDSIDVDEARAMPGVVAVWTAAELGVAPHHGFVKVHDRLRPPAARHRSRALRRRGDRRRVRRDAGAGRRRRSDRVRRLRAAAVGHRPRGGARADAPVLFPEHGDQPRRRRVVRPGTRPRGGLRRRRARPLRQPAHRRRPDGAARRAPPRRPTTGGSRCGRPTRCRTTSRASSPAALGIDAERSTSITPQVGGGFGGKAGLHPEYTVVAAAARRLGRPVVWVPTRSEDMQATAHSRGQIQYAELGCRTDGTFTGLRVRLVGDAGAYPGIGAVPARRHAAHVARHVRLPGDPVRRRRRRHQHHADGRLPRRRPARGDGAARAARRPGRARARHRPDRAARAQPARRRRVPVHHAHRQHLRQRPLPSPAAHRRATRSATTSCAREQAARRERGDTVLLGIGVAAYVEITAGGGAASSARSRSTTTARPRCTAGTLVARPGPPDRFAMLVSDQTGIPIDRITLVDGDTDLVPQGGGTGGSRSLQLGGSAVHRATEVAGRARRRRSPPSCSRPTWPTSWSTRQPAPSAWPACRPPR